ncbi:MAG: Ig-like domain-containing protein [Lachnospiraceae bacterium]
MIKGQYNRKFRYLAGFLCVALYLTSSPVQTFAADISITDAAGTIEGITNGEEGNNTDASLDSGEQNNNSHANEPEDGNHSGAVNPDSDSGNTDGSDDTDPSEEDLDGNNPENSDPDNPDGEEGGNIDQGDPDIDLDDPNPDDTDTDDSDIDDTPEDQEFPDDSSDSELDTESVSGNDLSSVSENDLSSISENSLDEDRTAMIEAAQEAFTRLLSEKDLMALLYHADTYNARLEPAEDSESAGTLEIGQTLYIRGVEITEEDVWYEVQFWMSGVEGTGYVQSYYLAYADEDWIAWEEEYLLPILETGEGYGISAYGMRSSSVMPYAVNTSDISAFPGSYQGALRSLKNTHPNWTFVPMKTGLDFNTSVSKEMGAKSLIQNTTSNASKGWVGGVCPSEKGWYYATRPAVEYCMDPRNFLTETYIFQFEQLTFNASYHTQSAVQSFLNTTFMKGVLPDDSAKRTYAQAFYEIGQKRRLSPIHLASRVYQEQGKGTSGLISGKYPGYEGYYNFFNIDVWGASTEEKITRGLTYAKNKGWNTRYKSLEGGAATIGNNYILKYQDTLYLEKFNVDKNSPYGIYEHQYMQNIQAPASEASSTKKMYANAGSLNSAFVFKIPVYNNMPNESGAGEPVQPEEPKPPVLKLNKTALNMDRSKTDDCVKGQQLRLYADGVEVTEFAKGSSTAAQGQDGAEDRFTAGEQSQAADSSEKVEWTSSDESVVKIEIENGLAMVKAVEKEQKGKPGEATVTATYKDASISCKVKVQASLQSISLDKTEIALRRSDTVVEDVTGLSEAERAENKEAEFLQVSFDPDDTTSNKTIAWTSSNTRVAKVTVMANPDDPTDTSRATVTAVGKGEAVITAKASKAGVSPVRTAACRVKVSAPIYQIALSNPNADETGSEERTTLLAGQSVNLAAEYWPKDTTSDTQVSWNSSNEKAAVVRNGRVEAKAKGTAVITAKVAGCAQGYTAQHMIDVEECHVTFMKENGDPGNDKDILKKLSVLYGGKAAEQEFPEKPGEEGTNNRIFIGWYTGKNGTGSRFDADTVIHRQETVLYPYYEELGQGFYVLPVGDQVYTGSAIKPVVQVYDSVSYEDGSRELIELVLNKDYTVSYKNNRNVNLEGKAVPTIIVRGKGNYAGTESVLFNIVPKALTDTDIVTDDMTVAYSGRVIKSVPVIYRNGKKLARNTDYTVSYPQTGTGAYQTAGTYPILIKGKGGYTGTVTVYETITQNVLMSKVSVAKIPNQTYRNELVDKEQGIGIMPENLKVTYKKEVLTESKDGGMTGDYTVSYKNNTAVGTATATITAVEGSGFSGSKSITYKIVGTSITRAKVEGLENKEYTGREADVKQDPSSYTLTLNGNILTESEDGGVTGDYIVSYSNLTKAGTATILFKGINEYTGQIKKSYKITAYNISPDESGRNPAIEMQYYTQDAPDQRKEIETLSEIETPYMKGGSKPGVILTFNGIELQPGKDYTIRYANNNAVTTEEMTEKKLPKITVAGKGSFKGSLTGYFTITDGVMTPGEGKSKLTMTAKDVVYKNRKNAYKSSVILTDCNGARLAAGRDYEKTLVYTYVGDDTKKAYDSGVTLERPEEVLEDDLKAGRFSEADITAGAKELSGEEVEVGPDDIPEVGTLIRVTAYGKGCYAGDGNASISAVYRIVAADISKARVKVQAKEYRNGRPVTLNEEDLQLTISGSQEPLQYGVDYIIDESTYLKNQNKGKATVVIRGIGNYGGEKKITYTIGTKRLIFP